MHALEIDSDALRSGALTKPVRTRQKIEANADDPNRESRSPDLPVAPDVGLAGFGALAEADFKAQLIALIPHLRAFAFSLVRRPEAEDLAQEAIARAWRARASYQPGTNLKAWLFTILRNEHFTRGRRAWRTVALDPGVAEATLVAIDDASAREELLDVRNAMMLLSFDHRQALVLVTAAGLSYAESALICACAVGTVKSRVSRARVELTAILERQKVQKRIRSDIPASMALNAIMTDVEHLRQATGGATSFSGSAGVGTMAGQGVRESLGPNAPQVPRRREAPGRGASTGIV